MKIGIISMQRVPNYGSFLQAFALKHTLENLNCHVEFIDYKPGKPIVPYNKIKRAAYIVANSAFVRYTIDRVKLIHTPNDFKANYRLHFLPQLGVTYSRKSILKSDAVIIGSDEVFNCLTNNFNIGYSPMLLGDVSNAPKIYTYAASAGQTTYENLKEVGAVEITNQYLNHIDKFSVRDENTRIFIGQLTKSLPDINLDPVLIYDFELPKVKRLHPRYVVLYTYPSRKYSLTEQKMIKDFCNRMECVLISFGAAQEWIPNKYLFDPLTMLAHFKQANYIITDTFHGTVFSIKYNCNFVSYIRPDNKNKLLDLLTRLKREDRIIEDYSELDTLFGNDIQYDETNEILNVEKNRTLDYLSKIVAMDI